jgi:hypothetical protein
MARRDPYVLALVHRLGVAWLLVQLAVWAAFLLVFPAMCLLRGLTGAALLLAALGLFLDLKAVDLLLGWARGWAPTLRLLMIGYHASLAVAAVATLMRPIDPRWTRVPGTADNNDTTVAVLRDGLAIGSGGGTFLTFHDDRDGSVRPLDYVGGPSWILQPGPEDSLWVAPTNDPKLHVRDARGAWSQIPRPAGYPRALAPGRADVWLVADALHRLDRASGRWELVGACERPTGVALAPDEREVLVVGRRWCARVDDGPWIDVSPADIEELGRFPEAAIGGGGWRHVFTSGFLASTLHVRGPDDAGFTPREPPVRDIRVLIADPVDGRRVWLATWGEGVHFTADAGATWRSLGLRRVQVRGLAVDFTRGRVVAASSNTIFDRGAYVRTMDE